MRSKSLVNEIESIYDEVCLSHNEAFEVFACHIILSAATSVTIVLFECKLHKLCLLLEDALSCHFPR